METLEGKGCEELSKSQGWGSYSRARAGGRYNPARTDYIFLMDPW